MSPFVNRTSQRTPPSPLFSPPRMKTPHHQTRDDFSEQNIINTVSLFRQDLTVEEHRSEEGEANNLRSITAVVKQFKTETEDSWKKSRDAGDICTQLFLSSNDEDNWKAELFSWVIPYLIALVIAFLPGLLRLAFGEDFLDEAGQITEESADGQFGTQRAERFVALFYLASMCIIVTLLVLKINSWISAAALALYQYDAISNLGNAYRSESFGLSFHVPLVTPDNLMGWMMVRRELYRTISDNLNEIFRIEVLISPLVLITMILAIAIFVNAVAGEAFGIFNIIGFVLLVLLSLYVCGILFITAYANYILNDQVIMALNAQKYNITNGEWQGAKQRKGVNGECSNKQKNKKKRRSISNNNNNNKKKKKYGDVGVGRESSEVKSSEALVHFGHAPLDVDMLAAMEMMIDSANERIKNSDDEGLYIKVFGFEITFGVLAAVASALATAISAGIAEFTQQ
mmetsp:Transcript_26156/g.43767  ORF Transcript_26156/g.43767 Transcript_26156/m.43767 type:complete len:457 (+) Transcript_26156:2782-4152(+)